MGGRFGLEFKASTSRLMVIISLHDGTMKRECRSVFWRGARARVFVLLCHVLWGWTLDSWSLTCNDSACYLPLLGCNVLAWVLSHTQTHMYEHPQDLWKWSMNDITALSELWCLGFTNKTHLLDSLLIVFILHVVYQNALCPLDIYWLIWSTCLLARLFQHLLGSSVLLIYRD